MIKRNLPVNNSPAVRQMGQLAKLMDAQFSIPGTGYRFGLDGII
ncbi:MAG: DUF4112 domain-containing protein, partial [Sphingobacteriales bacterium]